MKHLGLTLDELTEVVRTCSQVVIEDCTPHYLQEFIASRLAGPHPVLADKVRRFDQEQMDAVCEHVKATYRLLRCA